MEKVISSSNLLNLIFCYLEPKDLTKFLQLSKFCYEKGTKDSLWWPIYYRIFSNVRIIDRAITSGYKAVALSYNNLTDRKNRVHKADVKYSVRILGFLGLLPISPTLEQRYGKCFSFLNIFSNMFIFQNKMYCVSALGIPDETYIYEGLNATHCYLIFLNLELPDWRDRLERIWTSLKKFNAINSVLIFNSSKAGYNPEDPMLAEINNYGIPIKTLSETDENKFTDIICSILEKCKKHEEIVQSTDTSHAYDVYRKQVNSSHGNKSKCTIF